MASVPNTRAAPLPVPPGKAPAPAQPAGFAGKLAGIPEELLQIPAAILGGEGTVPDGDGKDAGAETETPAPTDVPSDAAQLAALAPLLQSLPALVAAPVTPAVLATAQVAAPAPSKIETAAAAAPAPTALPQAPTPARLPTGKIGKVKAEAENDETVADTDSQGSAPSLDAAARQVIAAAKRTLDAALRAADPALVEAAPKTARIVASALQAIADTPRPMTGGETKTRAADIATSAALAQPAAPALAPSAAQQPREATAPAADRTLNLATDAEWIDRLARDIAQASGNEGTISFRLNPQTLGHLRVELSQGDHGASIRLTTDTEHARAILADAQPRLVAEARAQGVRIAETHVDLSGSDRNASGDPRRQDETRQTPLIRTARDAAVDADAPERPSRLRSDRYA